MRLTIFAVIFWVLLAPLPVAAQSMGWDGKPVQPLPPAQGAPYGYAPGYTINPQTLFIYEEEKKSPGLALFLSFLLPGLGNIYADHAMGAVITWGLIIGGASIIAWGVNHTNPDTGGGGGVDAGGALFMGFFVILGGVAYSLVDSYLSAKDYNQELARRLGLPVVGIAPIHTSGDNATAWGPALMLRF
jgi:TM2 domain-containing membrane protein YozV